MKLPIKPHIVFQIVLVLTSFFFMYAHAVTTLVSDWSNDPNFSHWVFYCPHGPLHGLGEKRKLATMKLAPSNHGLFIIFIGMMIHLAGHTGAERFLMRFP